MAREIGQKPSTFAPPRDGASEALSPVAKHVSETPIFDTGGDCARHPAAPSWAPERPIRLAEIVDQIFLVAVHHPNTMIDCSRLWLVRLVEVDEPELFTQLANSPLPTKQNLLSLEVGELG